MAQYAPAEGAAILVMDVNTGAILGMTDYPNYDLNDPFTITDPFLLDSIEAAENEEEELLDAPEGLEIPEADVLPLDEENIPEADAEEPAPLPDEDTDEETE